ncbi:HAMP domain-containing sensor histidine kinase [Paenibacillus sp. FSL R7-0337]|uniref:HAMP domain-containing sensor histidine kinase n=1 Tax=Paenibacillus sp. FSL R7-0337 TaxID=1926588 RepID=UPI00096EB370|nr:HAMP domain-containing sensor histidine kinase [Paenibacillus sp. FSL R7-0337]OMF98140.1 two-component sensor histidine kinase [Paenibacillus sp. FSL R7-0337]
MNHKLRLSRLKLKLILCLIGSFVASAGLFLLLQSTGEDLLEHYRTRSSFIHKQEEQALPALQAYISGQHLSLKDDAKIAEWVRDAKYVNLYLYKDNQFLYSTDGYTIKTENTRFLPDPNIFSKSQYSTVTFADTTAQVYMEYFFEYKYYNLITILGVILSFIFFIVLVLFFINKKTSYIGVLEKEIKILEGGNLDYPITLKGKDELSSLAQSINEMRKSFIERLESEERARVANSELVTAMSHDLRTPLTALVGYLDIIEYKKYQDQEALAKYIHNSREKAYQIKHLSDKLFEYFTVYNTEENDLEFESYDGIQLMDQLIDEHSMLLENHGFQVAWEPSPVPFRVDLHLISFRRVFDNLFSNITKYADTSAPVTIAYRIEDRWLLMDITNVIKTEDHEVHSTGIGLKTCHKIISQHKGEITFTSTGSRYSVHIRLPVDTAQPQP